MSRCTIGVQNALLRGARSGDHTVKLVCCRTGACVRVLTGHRRTPWVVRFHPRSSALLASGSLDYEARPPGALRGVCVQRRAVGCSRCACAARVGQLLAPASPTVLPWGGRPLGAALCRGQAQAQLPMSV